MESNGTENHFIYQMLQINPRQHRLIGVVGAGGKSTLIYRLARELRMMGYRPAVTTTTHMFREGMYGFSPIGNGVCGEKMEGVSPEVPGKLLEEYDFVLVEADGSRRLPFKIPAKHEPVLPDGADLVIGVAGAGAIGQTFRKGCFRWEEACRRFGCEPEDSITIRHLLASLTGSFGQKKGVTCDYRYVIGQGDLLSSEQMEDICRIGSKYREWGAVLSFTDERFWNIMIP